MPTAVFSCEEKRRIILFAADNSLDGLLIPAEEEKWQELGRLISRDWRETRDAYWQWRVEDAQSDVRKIEADEQQHEHAGDQEAAFREEDARDMELVAELEVANAEVNQNDDQLCYLPLNGRYVDVIAYDQYLLNHPEAEVNINYDDQGVLAMGKRPLDLSAFDENLLKTFEDQSREELEMRREEHEKKMKIYKVQLEHGEELHKEKMKILKAKLKNIQQQVHHIDHVICNRRLKRKFKSGPI